jgi:general L-amino acid transport system substrate-binding protein
MKRRLLAAAVGAAALLISGSALAGPVLDAIKARGALICGVPTGIAGFAAADRSPRCCSAIRRRSSTCR